MDGTRTIMHWGKGTILVLLFSISSDLSFGQTNLKSLLEQAEKNYPAIAAKQAEAEAARANVALEKNTLLPSLDASYQANYSTYNNITGMSYPGNLMPISGPPSDDNYGAVPGSAASLVFKWTPLTFGQRSASVGYSEKMYEKQLAAVEDEVLKVKLRTAFMYLEIAATGELIKAYEKNIERNEFNLRQVSALVRSGIRPAVDSLKFKGELSKTKVALYELQNQLEINKQELAEALATDNLNDLQLDEPLFQNLPVLNDLTGTIQNPLLHMAQYEVEAQDASLKKIKRMWVPSLEFWSTVYGRGSGIAYDGTIRRPDGWSLTRYNYGVGIQVVFPILDFANITIKTRRQEALLTLSKNYFSLTQLSLKKQELTTAGSLAASVRIAREIPIEFEASEAAYNALQARYKNGLVDYTELIQAQYDLLNAETRLKNAHINAWKSLLKLAVIRGDINIFLNQIQN